MQPPPPPLAAAKPKPPVPKWVWWMAGASVLFLVGTYALVFVGWNWAMNLQRQDFSKMNPDFEFLYVTTKGKIRAKHKVSGREFVFDEARPWEVIQIATLAAEPVKGPLPEWLVLPQSKAEDENSFLVEGAQSYDVLAEIEDVSTKRGYRRERPSGVSLARELVTCNPKTLECLACSIRGVANGTRYEIWRSRVP